MIGLNENTNQLNRNSTQMSLWASPALTSTDNNPNAEASPKIKNFMNQLVDAPKRHSNSILAKSENTDLNRS